MKTEQEAKISEVANRAELPKLLARATEDVMRSELHRFEANFGTAFKSGVDRAITSLIVLASGVAGIGCLWLR